MTNLGQHSLDIVHWFLGARSPVRVSSEGGRFILADNGETPDVQEARFDYGSWAATWSHRECSRGKPPFHGLEFCGTNGSLTISRRGFSVTPDPAIPPEEMIPRFGGAHPRGGPEGAEQRRTGPPRTPAIEDQSGDEFDQFRRHARDFLDCVRSRNTPISGLEDAHRVATACHLANLALRLGRPLRWDPDRETILDDPEAEKMLERPYRPPWDAERRALLGF